MLWEYTKIVHLIILDASAILLLIDWETILDHSGRQRQTNHSNCNTAVKLSVFDFLILAEEPSDVQVVQQMHRVMLYVQCFLQHVGRHR